MASSASGRIPIEVWELILGHAIKSPLLPFLEDGTLSFGLIENLDLFSTRCQSFGRYRNRLLRFRSVCHAWAHILHPIMTECAFFYEDLGGRPSERVSKQTKRLYIGVLPKCSCQQAQGCSLSELTRRKFLDLDESTLIDTVSRNLRILTLAKRSPVSVHFVEELSNLLALSIDTELLKDPGLFNMLPTSVAHISHLQLSISTTDFLTDNLELPHVRYLILDLQFFPNIFEWRMLLEKWTFRSLRTFTLLGSIEHFYSWTSWIPDFLYRHRERLLELSVVHHRVSNSITRVTSRVAPILKLFNCCPRLTTIGMSIQVFEWIQTGALWTARHSPSRPTILIHDLQYKNGLSKELFHSFHPLKDQWNVEKIVFSVGWDDLGIIRALDLGADIELHHQELLDAAEATEIPIFDQHGTPLQGFLEKQITLWQSETLIRSASVLSSHDKI
jgi:hypothetical protein